MDLQNNKKVKHRKLKLLILFLCITTPIALAIYYLDLDDHQKVTLFSSVLSLLSASIVKGFLKSSSEYNNKDANNPDALCALVRCMGCYTDYLKEYIKSEGCNINDSKYNTDDINNGIAYEITLHSFSFFTQLLSLWGLLFFKVISISSNGSAILLLAITFIVLAYIREALSKYTEFHYKLYLYPDSSKTIYNFLKHYSQTVAVYIALNMPPPRMCITIGRLLILILSGISVLIL